MFLYDFFNLLPSPPIYSEIVFTEANLLNLEILEQLGKETCQFPSLLKFKKNE